MMYISAALKMISVRTELSLRIHYLGIRLSVCPFFLSRTVGRIFLDFFHEVRASSNSRKVTEPVFFKKICFWILVQKNIKWAQNLPGSIQIVSGITRVQNRFLRREYLHPKVDQPDAMNVICTS